MIEITNSIKQKNKIFKVYNAYERYKFHEIPMCGEEKCQLPVVEIGLIDSKQKEDAQKPKLLITAGLDGKEKVAISVAMNFIKYIGCKFINISIYIIYVRKKNFLMQYEINK